MDSEDIKRERTLVLLKPDAVARGLVGAIIGRFERAGLKLVAMKLVAPTRNMALGHYGEAKGWIRGMGQKTLDSFKEFGMDVKAVLGTEDPYEIGLMVRDWLVDYVSSGPVVAMVLEGVHAIVAVRKMIGFTIPARAEPGTIRGDYSIDSNTISSLERRATKNLIHASGNREEAAQEIAFWFRPDEIVDYRRADEDIMF